MLYKCHQDIFVEGTKDLIEKERKQVLRNALSNEECQRLFIRLSSLKPYDLNFPDLIKHLKNNFINKSLFQRHFEALNFCISHGC